MDTESIVTRAKWAEALSRGGATKDTMLQMDGGVLAAETFADRLHLTSEDLRRMPLFRLDADGAHVYPAFQISEDGLLPGIEEVVNAFSVQDNWMRVNFMLTGDARLAHRRPIDVLREGHINDVIKAARAYGEHGAA